MLIINYILRSFLFILFQNNYIGVQSFDRISTRTIDNEDKIAGSTALILNCRPTQIPAKLPKEQLEHEKLYEEILKNAKKNGNFKHTYCCCSFYLKITLNIFHFAESEKAKKHKEHLKQKLKNEERLANVTKIWAQEIIPNWHKMQYIIFKSQTSLLIL